MQLIHVLKTAVLLLAMPSVALASSVQQTLEVEGETNIAGQQSQQKISELSRETQELLREYRQLMQQADYQQAYNQELERRLQEQEQEMQELQEDIAEVQITRLHVMPLLRDMVQALEQFVELDLPFEQEARLASVKRLEDVLASGNTPLAEKFRRVMEAWQAESDYSYEIHSYRDELLLDDRELKADFLRIGRSAWYFQTLNGEKSGYWDRGRGEWQLLAPRHNAAVRRAIRLADQQLAPELLTLPVAADEVQE